MPAYIDDAKIAVAKDRSPSASSDQKANINKQFRDAGAPEALPSSGCGASACAGCCEANGCLKGQDVEHCGQNGAPCQNCLATNQVCLLGKCLPCTTDTQCRGDTLCIDPPGQGNQCLRAYGQIYRIILVSARLKPFFWDIDGDPDPYAVLKIDGQVLTTTVKSDTLSPTWNEHLDHIVNKGGSVTIDVYDKDSPKDTWVGQIEFKKGIPLQTLREKKYLYSSHNAKDLLESFELNLKMIFPP